MQRYNIPVISPNNYQKKIIRFGQKLIFSSIFHPLLPDSTNHLLVSLPFLPYRNPCLIGGFSPFAFSSNGTTEYYTHNQRTDSHALIALLQLPSLERGGGISILRVQEEQLKGKAEATIVVRAI
jgi:hypothetical protein